MAAREFYWRKANNGAADVWHPRVEDWGESFSEIGVHTRFVGVLFGLSEETSCVFILSLQKRKVARSQSAVHLEIMLSKLDKDGRELMRALCTRYHNTLSELPEDDLFDVKRVARAEKVYRATRKRYHRSEPSRDQSKAYLAEMADRLEDACPTV